MDLENYWPRYDEHGKANNGQCIWGDIKLGHLPTFVYDDRSVSQVHANANSRTQEALNYKARYLDAFQYYQARCQHHNHPVSEVTKKRIVPHSCRPASNKNRVECKHGAPWVERLNHVGPLLICRRIAKTRKLKCTGARNVL